MDLERRREVRLAIEMWVEETAEDSSLYFQRTANLSVGGMFLEATVPHPVGTRVSLRFTLPGDRTPIEAKAEIVNAGQGGDAIGMGLKFIDLPPAAGQRIGQFVAEHTR
jgi:uncharacterized protein (TIGR02266 family)